MTKNEAVQSILKKLDRGIILEREALPLLMELGLTEQEARHLLDGEEPTLR